MKSNVLPVQEMERILKSLQMKKEACQMLATEDTSQPVTNYILHSDLLKKGMECDVSLTMLRPHEIQRTLTSEEAKLLAECYSVTADAILLLLDIRNSNPTAGLKLKECIDLLAEAQSQVRSVVESLGLQKDEDQCGLFMMLRSFSREQRVYLPQLSNSKANVTNDEVDELQNKIINARIPLDSQRQINIKLKQLQGLISAKPENEKHWLLIAGQVARLISTGVMPSNKELRNLLLPVFEEIPALDTYPKEFGQVINSIDSYLATRPDVDEANISQEPPIQQVTSVRKLLEGRKVVLIGGSERKSPKRKLEEAFGLDELTWISTTSHTPVKHFEPYIHKKDVAIALLAIKFSSYRFKEVKVDCDKANVLLVRLPSGYGINQVALQILEQCGDRLTRSPLCI